MKFKLKLDNIVSAAGCIPRKSQWRRETRIRCRRRVVVELDDGSRRSIMVENLSLGGICLDQAPVGWRPEVEVHFSLVIREGVLPLDGVICWRRKDSVGISFKPRSVHHDKLLQMAVRLLLDSAS